MVGTMKNLGRISRVLMTLALVFTIALGSSMTVNAAENTKKTETKTVTTVSKAAIKKIKSNANKYGWSFTATVKSETKKKRVVELHFYNSEWSMKLKQVVAKSGKNYTTTYYQGKTKIAYSGIARTLKKYSDQS